MPDENSLSTKARHTPWNKGELIGAKPPLRPSQVWSIRTRLLIERRTRDLALFNLAIDRKLRGCDIVALRVGDVAPNGYAVDRATVRQKKTGRPGVFAGNKVALWGSEAGALKAGNYPLDEFVYVLEGDLVTVDADGSRHEFHPGDAFVIPKGWAGTWDMKTRFKKIIVNF
jgi:uncharacterized cupin superfamily protein